MMFCHFALAVMFGDMKLAFVGRISSLHTAAVHCCYCVTRRYIAVQIMLM